MTPYLEADEIFALSAFSWDACEFGEELMADTAPSSTWFFRERIACYDRVGGERARELRHAECELPLSEAAADMAPLYRIPPRYPEVALALGREGRVLVDFVVGGLGHVSDVEVIASEGEGFEDAAVEAVSEWIYCLADDASTTRDPLRIAIPFRLGPAPE